MTAAGGSAASAAVRFRAMDPSTDTRVVIVMPAYNAARTLERTYADIPHELIDTHGVYKPVHLGVSHKRPLAKARKHAEKLFKVSTRNMAGTAMRCW